MQSLPLFTAPPTICGYLPDRLWSLEYEFVLAMTPQEYLGLMLDNWRRFGRTLFRPACPGCRTCRAVRVLVRQFRPNRSQRRVRKANAGVVRLEIGRPSVTREKLALYDRYHAHQAEVRGWPEHPPRDASSYTESYIRHPFPVEEWCYYLDGRLVGVGYVDCLPDDCPDPSVPDQGGLSAIYFFYDPDERHRSLGTWNVLNLIDEAARRGLPHVYLGYFVEGCGSMEYKPCFVPNELRGDDGVWRLFRT
jgi:arginine-tRNA-protein transferase